MAYRLVSQLLRRAEKLLPKLRGDVPDAYREIVMKTNGGWPSEDEMALRNLLEKAVTDSGIAECLGVDAGDGSVSLWIRIKAEVKPQTDAEIAAEDEERAMMEASLRRGRVFSIKMPDPPPGIGDGTLGGFVLLLIDDLIADAERGPPPRVNAKTRAKALRDAERALGWMRKMRSEVEELIARVAPHASPVSAAPRLKKRA